jgi:DNA-binding NarL/FixJ family response regulator
MGDCPNAGCAPSGAAGIIVDEACTSSVHSVAGGERGMPPKGGAMPGRSGGERPNAATPKPVRTSGALRCGDGRALTAREETVLRLVVDGKRNLEISNELDISERTVKFHVSGLFAKLGVSSRTQLVSLALRERLLES